MIHNEANKFVALASLMLPTIINKDRMESEITDESAVLFFQLEEPFPIGYVMEQLDDDFDLRLLYHATKGKIHHVCYFANPRDGNAMFKINIHTNLREYVENITVTIYESLDMWEDDLEVDVKAHQKDFDFVVQMQPQELLSIFCKMNYGE